MSKGDLIKTINDELQHLNREIDIKIIKGLPYKREAKRHRFLLSQLWSLSAGLHTGWFKKAATMISSFVL